MKYNIILKRHLIHSTFSYGYVYLANKKTTSTTDTSMWGTRAFLTSERNSHARRYEP
jgi:hypothetical protein